jgi:glutaredoxin
MPDQIPVKMYTLSTCSHCKAAKKFMADLGVEYEFKDVDLLEGMDKIRAVNELRKINPSCSFPTIIIGDKVIVGNRSQEIKEALGLS